MRKIVISTIALYVTIVAPGQAHGISEARDTATVKVVREQSASVVNIRTERVLDLKNNEIWGEYGEQLDAFFNRYYAKNYADGTLKFKSVGSGVIVDDEGLVVTNAHVVHKASAIYVVLSDGNTFIGRTVAVDPDNDLALIKIDAPPIILDVVPFADADDIMVGETIVVIGNPFGLENSVTVGIISGKNRVFQHAFCRYGCEGLMQIDAPINPGSSGGALLNLDGELVGIALAVIQKAENIGFAIPVNKIVELVESYEDSESGYSTIRSQELP